MPEENAPQETAVDYVDLTADIVSAYVSKNSVRPADLGELITSVHQTLRACRRLNRLAGLAFSSL
ncbi:MucR family transcriptional regulator [Methylobacterium sp. Leaf117]|uniref:MucR family transcriptional regulator n=1 Tax=Methylobacterium sp. Leaf117 TaxID=1736260 RepID=UPI0009E8E828|nr:MucR family transcriptional regulator [Methylobacterium sp. Leaf117]